jgi:hypothetical protein
MTIWRMRVASWIPKATDKHSKYVTLAVFFLLRLWLLEPVSALRHTYTACTDKLHLSCVTTLFQLYRLMRCGTDRERRHMIVKR